uniref:Uncharacterized protein n=1 Tax=Glossina palpalis gambiensis TaxID=67801 RepID=A0A1B0BHN7_9MUSC
MESDNSTVIRRDSAKHKTSNVAELFECKTANKSTKAVDDGDCGDDGINMAMGSELNDDTTPLLASTPKAANSNGKSLHRFFGNCVKNNFFNIAKEAPKCLSSNNPYMQLRPQLHTTHKHLSSELREKILEMSKRSSASDETNELTHEEQETTRSKQDDDEVNRANYYEVSKSNKNCYQQLSLATCAPLKLQNDFVDNMKSASGGEVNNATFVISQNTIELNSKANDRNDERIKQKPQNANSVKRMKWTINDDNNFEFADDKEQCDNMNHSKNEKDIGTVATDIQPIKERINFFNKLTNNYKDIKSKFIKQSTKHKINPNNRIAPPDTPTHALGGYVITPQRLTEIRSYFMYWFFDQDMYEGRGDYQYDIHVSTTQIHKNLNFQLPFFGFRFNYTRVSLNGYLEFSDPPEYYTYPLVFPIKDWPKKNDPSFIGIFFSKCRVGRIYATDIDQRTPGVYFRSIMPGVGFSSALPLNGKRALDKKTLKDPEEKMKKALSAWY